MSSEFTTAFIEQQLKNADNRVTPDWLKIIKDSGAQQFKKSELPTRKTEDWKYTSLFQLTSEDFSQTAPVINTQAPAIEKLDAFRLVFLNGRLSAEQSDQKALELITQFNQADESQQAIIANHLGNITASQGHLFNALNDAVFDQGLLLHIEKNQQLEKPLHLIHLNEGDQFSVQPRLLVVLEQSANATLVEHYAGTGKSFTNANTEVHVGDNAKLIHYRLQLMDEQAFHIGSVHTNLERDANYESFHLGLGTTLCRNDIVVNHNVGGSHCEMSGVYVPQNNQHVDFHTCIEHKAAHCTSNEIFRGIMNDHSKAVFNGRIHIHRDAQKTLAELSNKNLLLTNTAEINTKPELEIYADDVRCAHGATVAQLEEKALFYMRSRGINKAEAEVMLSFGFINELLDALPDESISLWLRPILANRFGRDEALTAHLV